MFKADRPNRSEEKVKSGQEQVDLWLAKGFNFVVIHEDGAVQAANMKDMLPQDLEVIDLNTNQAKVAKVIETWSLKMDQLDSEEDSRNKEIISNAKSAPPIPGLHTHEKQGYPEGSVRYKLDNLETLLPGQEGTIYHLAKFLATRANDSLVPQGFDLMAQLAIYDLEQGKDGFTGEPLTGKLVGYPKQMYVIMSAMLVPQIKKVIF